ncbi:MAG: hypothetical protein OXE73_04130 [Gammaproteobacteria bacterium]|nr:hypothetical protein [Gammaproteobacteria bacterium]
MGELSSVDNDLDRIWIDPNSDGTCPFVPGDPSVNPISRALEKAEMPNWVRSDSRFWIERGGRATVYSVSDTVEHWLERWTAMARGSTRDKSDESPLEGISLVVDHAIRFIHAESIPDSYHRIVLTLFDRLFWIMLSFIEGEADPETRATMARQLSEVFDVEDREAQGSGRATRTFDT